MGLVLKYAAFAFIILLSFSFAALTCDSSNSTSCTSAFRMSNNTPKSGMCGTNQYYMINTTQQQNITWTLTPSSTADYTLYVYSSTCGGTIKCTSSHAGAGVVEKCSAVLPAGAYYARAYKVSGSGNYSMNVQLTAPPLPPCDNYSYTSCTSAYAMSNNTPKSGMCGTNQYYLINTTQQQNITWTLTPSSTADYTLYVYSSGCGGTIKCTSSHAGVGVIEKCSAVLPAGVYYARAYKVSGSGNYSMNVILTTLPSPQPPICGNNSCASCASAYTLSNNVTIISASGSTQYYKITTVGIQNIIWNMQNLGTASYNFSMMIKRDTCDENSSWWQNHFIPSGSGVSMELVNFLGGTYYAKISKINGSGNYSIGAETILSPPCSYLYDSCTFPNITDNRSPHIMTNNTPVTGMCGQNQNYMIITNRTQNITWTLTPSSTAEYMLWTSSELCGIQQCISSRVGAGVIQSCSEVLPAGTYYGSAIALQPPDEPGINYSINVVLTAPPHYPVNIKIINYTQEIETGFIGNIFWNVNGSANETGLYVAYNADKSDAKRYSMPTFFNSSYMALIMPHNGSCLVYIRPYAIDSSKNAAVYGDWLSINTADYCSAPNISTSGFSMQALDSGSDCDLFMPNPITPLNPLDMARVSIMPLKLNLTASNITDCKPIFFSDCMGNDGIFDVHCLNDLAWGVSAVISDGTSEIVAVGGGAVLGEEQVDANLISTTSSLSTETGFVTSRSIFEIGQFAPKLEAFIPATGETLELTGVQAGRLEELGVVAKSADGHIIGAYPDLLKWYLAGGDEATITLLNSKSFSTPFTELCLENGVTVDSLKIFVQNGNWATADEASTTLNALMKTQGDGAVQVLDDTTKYEVAKVNPNSDTGLKNVDLYANVNGKEVWTEAKIADTKLVDVSKLNNYLEDAQAQLSGASGERVLAINLKYGSEASKTDIINHINQWFTNSDPSATIQKVTVELNDEIFIITR